MNSILLSTKRSNALRYVNGLKDDRVAGVMKILKRSTSIVGAPGSGAGRGGGAGGTIKEGGGGLGVMGTAKEEGYFYDKQRQQIQDLKRQLAAAEEVKKGQQSLNKKQK